MYPRLPAWLEASAAAESGWLLLFLMAVIGVAVLWVRKSDSRRLMWFFVGTYMLLLAGAVLRR